MAKPIVSNPALVKTSKSKPSRLLSTDRATGSMKTKEAGTPHKKAKSHIVPASMILSDERLLLRTLAKDAENLADDITHLHDRLGKMIVMGSGILVGMEEPIEN
jgi:hypothetical protein